MGGADDWLHAKAALDALTGLDRDALHIYVAVGVQIAAALLLRRRLGDWLPWLVVLGLALLGEAGDLYVEIWPQHAMQAGKALHDILNTMALPTLLLLLSRWRPDLAGRS